jgi:two-component system, OmpR family, phosphate regulon sensor histidine kinase PhoR
MNKENTDNHSTSIHSKIGIIRHARRQFLAVLLIFLAVLAIPFAFLIRHIYSQLQAQAFTQHRELAQKLQQEIRQNLSDLISIEEHRPFKHYSFISISESSLVDTHRITFSPLSELLPEKEIPGMVGYFQINPNGTFQSPLLPIEDPLSTSLEERVEIKELDERKLLQENLRTIVESREVLKDFSEDPTQLIRIEETRMTKEQFQFSLSGFDASPFEPAPEHDETKSDIKSQSQTPPPGKSTKPWIIPVEMQINRFRAGLDSQEYIIFLRQVWYHDREFLQGFVVESNLFLQSIFPQAPESTTLDNAMQISFSNGENILAQTVFSKNGEPGKLTSYWYLLLQDRLSDALPQINVSFLVDGIPRNASSDLVTGLFICLILVFLMGLFGIYRLGLEHLEIAQERSDFVSAVSHELKTPLTSIRMHGEMLEKDWLLNDEERKASYSFISRESERLSRLIENVLQVARLRNNTVTLDIKKHSASEVLEAIESSVSSYIENQGFELSVSNNLGEEDREIFVYLDLDLLVQIFVNLIDNAIKFSKETACEQKVEIGIKTDNPDSNRENLIFYARDYGPGVAAEQQHKIFDLFYRGEDEMRRNTPGTGIGLCLVKDLAEKMSAQVKLICPDTGSEFQIVFEKKLVDVVKE